MATTSSSKPNKSPLFLSVDVKGLPNILFETTITMSMLNDMNDSMLSRDQQFSAQSSATSGSSRGWTKHEADGNPETHERELSIVPSRIYSNYSAAIYGPMKSTDTSMPTPRSYPLGMDNGIYMPSASDDNKYDAQWLLDSDMVLYGYPSLYSEEDSMLNLEVAQAINTHRLEDLRFYHSPASPYPSDSSQGFPDDHQLERFEDDDSHDESLVSRQKQRPSTKSENYATLLYQCLLSATDCQRELREIYRWFELYTDKANSTKDGWRNSVRHNLSMNEAFESVKRNQEDSSNRHWWRLTPKALQDRGVEPTTRFRNKPGKPRRSGHGGRIAKRSQHHDVRRSTRLNGPPRTIPYGTRQQQLMHAMDHEFTSNPDSTRLIARYSSLPPLVAHHSPRGYLSPHSSYDLEDHDSMFSPEINGLPRPESEPPSGFFDSNNSPLSPMSNHLSYYTSRTSTDEPVTPAADLNEEQIFGGFELSHRCDGDSGLGLDTERLFAWPNSN